MKRALPIFAFLAGFVALGAAVFFIVLPHGRATAAIGGPFALSASDGRTVTDKDMAGEPFLVFFGYTHCPDVCPAALSEMTSMFKELGPDPKARALFITVDPERDTPPVMKEYMSNFDPHIIGLTGTPQQIAAVAKEYRAYSKKVPDGNGSYTMDHLAITYLMDKDGRFVGAFNLDQPAKDAAASLKHYY